MKISDIKNKELRELAEEESYSWYNDTVESRKESYTNGTTPNYYTGKYKGIKAIDVIHDFELSHCKASALEYILRSGKKDDEIQDLTKAINHLQMQIEFLNR